MEFARTIKSLLTARVSMSIYLATAVILVAPFVLPQLATRLLPTSSKKTPNGIDLKDFIIRVKSDLEEAERTEIRKGERPLLALQQVELVANFVVQSKAEAEVKLVTVNGSALSGIEQSQQITLHLMPLPPVDSIVAPSGAPIATGPKVIGPTAPPGKGSKP